MGLDGIGRFLDSNCGVVQRRRAACAQVAPCAVYWVRVAL
jgi:hypothetical protein